MEIVFALIFNSIVCMNVLIVTLFSIAHRLSLLHQHEVNDFQYINTHTHALLSVRVYALLHLEDAVVLQTHRPYNGTKRDLPNVHETYNVTLFNFSPARTMPHVPTQSRMNTKTTTTVKP